MCSCGVVLDSHGGGLLWVWYGLGVRGGCGFNMFTCPFVGGRWRVRVVSSCLCLCLCLCFFCGLVVNGGGFRVLLFIFASTRVFVNICERACVCACMEG